MSQRSIPSDIEIARRAPLRPIQEVAAKLGIPENAVELYGKQKAKISLDEIRDIPQKKDAKLILVTAISPTPAGEGKTTVSVGLCDALNVLKKNACLALREPSLGPCFGVKGGAAGGGYAQIAPMEEINLHFTGDFHAITAAHNLIAAMVDNSLHQGNPLGLDSRRVTWGRALDVNERALRQIIVGLGGTVNSVPRESYFLITAASEIMAILCLSEDLRDLRERLGKIVVGYTPSGAPVTAADLKARGRPDEGSDQAEPRPNARRQPGVRSRRPVRQHRARLQQRRRDENRAQIRRLRRYGGRFRRRPRSGKILRRQMSQSRFNAELSGRRRDDSRAQISRRRRESRLGNAERRRRFERLCEPQATRRKRPQIRRSGRRRD